MTFPCSSPCAKATVLISEVSLMHWNATSSINSSSSVVLCPESLLSQVKIVSLYRIFLIHWTDTLSTKLLEVLWTFFNPSVSGDTALQLRRPILLTQMSAQKTVAFIKTWKKPCGQRGNGLLWKTEEAFVDIVSSAMLRYLRHRGARYFVSQCFLCFCCIQLKQQKAHWDSLSFFFPQNKHTKLPMLCCNCPVLREPNLVVFICTCFLAAQGRKNTLLGCFTYFLIPVLP